MILNASKRFLSLMLALLMVIALVPEITVEVSAAVSDTLSVDGLTYAESGTQITTSWTLSGNTIEGSVTGEADGCNNNSGKSTLTLTNNLNTAAVLSFDYILTLNSGTITIDGAGVTAKGSFEKELSSGGSIAIALTSKEGAYTTSISITNITLAVDTQVTTTFKTAANGSYTVDGTAVTATTEKKQSATKSYALKATANSGYMFFGWYDETAKSYIGYNAELSLVRTADSAIYPVFISANTAIFGVGAQKFYDLNEANTYASSQSIKKIVLLNNGTLPAGDYTISVGNTLLIPFDDAHTLYTTNPGFVNGGDSTYIKPTKAYRTLTMASGANITVKGAISVSAKHGTATGGYSNGGAVHDKYGQIVMESGSNITVNNGGALYAWGFITGSGTVTAKSGAGVYEYINVTDFRGGTQTAGMDNKVFPFAQYYIQNIEVPLTLHHGATESVYITLTMLRQDTSQMITFIGGSAAMFKTVEGTTITKSYDPTTDRMILEANGNIELNGLSMSVGVIGLTINVNSSDYVLPINNNFTIKFNSGTATVNQDLALLPGVEVYIGKNATLNVTKRENKAGWNVYVYDSAEWGTYVFGAGNSNKKLIPAVYSPTRTYTRTEADLKDVIIDVNGTVTVNGYLYTTNGGASIISSEGTGKIALVNGVGLETVTYQLIQKDPNEWVKIPITPAQLKNLDTTIPLFTQTAGATANTVFKWSTVAGGWIRENYVSTITLNANDGSDSPDTENIGYASGELPSNTFTNNGYSFKEWNDKADGSGNSFADEANITAIADITLYAQWTLENYTISYNLDGGVLGDGKTNPTTYTIKDNTITLNNPAKTGYTFAGWTGTDLNGNTETVTISTGSTGDRTYTANWTPENYTISYNLDGGVLEEGKTNPTTYTIEDNTITLNNPAKTGYTFTGWTGSNGEAAQTEVTITKGETGKKSYTANWEINQYTITFVDTDGTEIKKITQNFGTAVTAPDDPAKKGHTFTGWDVKIPETMPAEDMTITAQWKIKQYTITFADTGDTTIAPITQDYNSAVTAPAAPTKKGYTFTGWDVEVPATMPAEDMTITAQWNLKTYSITYNYQYKVDGNDYVVTDSYTIEDTITLPTSVERTGYTFGGWFDDKAYAGKAITQIEKGSTEDKTFYAQWTPKTDTEYIVNHWQQNIGGGSEENETNFKLIETEKLTGTTDASVTPAVKTYDGFTAPSAKTVTIAANGSTEVNYYYTRNSYTVTWKNYDGTDLETDLEVHYGTVPTFDQDEPTKDPTQQHTYTFKGWTPEVSEVTGNVEYTAVFDEKVREYEITWVNGNGEKIYTVSVAYNSTPVYDKDTYGEPKKATDGQYVYTFKGWDKAIMSVTGDATYTAEFKSSPASHTITFVTNGGKAVDDIDTAYNAKVTAPSTTKDGYTFNGWATENGGEVDYKAGATITVGTSDITLYAVWTIKQYTITFDTDGGSAVEAITQDFGTAVTAPKAPTKEGHTFTGWDTVIPATMPAENVTVKAIWAVNQYTITFVDTDGTEIAKITQNFGTAVTAPTDLTKVGYTFKGWDNLPTTMPAENVTITAKWKINQYTITFNTDGGSEITDITADFGTAVTKPVDPTKDGYTFTGWVDAQGNEAEVPTIMPVDGMSLKATWEINQYTITFVDTDGTEIDKITQDFGTAVTAPTNPTKTGYTFNGWEPTLPETMPAGNVTITAQWKIKQYTITFADTGDTTI
ncbi:MAG: InlB B-repeat-containing protein, partial [Oscillospiraceae bacterium]|nr:InlB B-repeat-containing protein [Oscillospiraceae bacterium]